MAHVSPPPRVTRQADAGQYRPFNHALWFGECCAIGFVGYHNRTADGHIISPVSSRALAGFVAHWNQCRSLSSHAAEHYLGIFGFESGDTLSVRIEVIDKDASHQERGAINFDTAILNDKGDAVMTLIGHMMFARQDDN